MNRTKLFTLVASLLFVCNVQGATPDPTPAPSPTPEIDPHLPNKTQVICGGTMTFASSQLGATRDSNTGNIFKLTPLIGSPDKRAETSGVVTLERDHEFAFNLSWIPMGSQLVRGEDLLTMTVRYQRHDGNKITVLAEGTMTSDQISSFSELNSRRVDIPVRTKFSNPEVATIHANREGQVPDGLTTTGSFDCYMRVGKATD